jgi:hypothetical protein
VRHARVEVVVDGTRWLEVTKLAEAGPRDKAYAVDFETGTITFGDGVHGRVPDAGSSIEIVLRYRTGGGSYQVKAPPGTVVRVKVRAAYLPAALALLAAGIAAVGLVGRRCDRP